VADVCECGNEPSGSVKCGKFLTSCKPVSFSRRTLDHGVSILSSTCFGYIRPSSGALDVELQLMVVCAVRMVHGTIRTAHTTYAAALKTTTHPKTRCRKPYAVTQHLILLMMGVCTRNMSS